MSDLPTRPRLRCNQNIATQLDRSHCHQRNQTAIALSRTETILCLQINDSDLIGASAGAMAALKRAATDAKSTVRLKAAVLIFDVYASIHSMLHSARGLPGIDPAILDASWKRSCEVRLPQNLAVVRPNMASADADLTILPRTSVVYSSATDIKMTVAASTPCALCCSKICRQLALRRCRCEFIAVSATTQIVAELWSERHIKGPDLSRSEAASTGPLLSALLHSIICSTVCCTQQRSLGCVHPCVQVTLVWQHVRVLLDDTCLRAAFSCAGWWWYSSAEASTSASIAARRGALSGGNSTSHVVPSANTSLAVRAEAAIQAIYCCLCERPARDCWLRMPGARLQHLPGQCRCASLVGRH